MIQIFSLYPVMGCIILIISAIFTVFISSRVYLAFNSHLLSVNKKDKSLFKTLKSSLFKRIDLIDAQDDNKRYKSIKTKMLCCGFYKNYAPIIYILLSYCIPILLFVLLLFTSSLESAILLPIAIVSSIQFVLTAQRKEIEREWSKNGYKIYRYVHNQLSAGVNIHDMLKSLYVIGIGTKLEVPLYEFSAWYGRTLDIDFSLEKFKQYFKLPDIQMLCTALEQGVKRGDIESLIERQEKSMFKQYFNYIQSETQKCNFKTGAIIIMLAGIICTMIMIPMMNDLGRAVNSIFGS